MNVVVKKLLDEVDVGENHSTTAVTLQIEFCKCFTFRTSIEEECEVGVPFVTDDFAAREAADGNNLCKQQGSSQKK